MPKTRSRTQAKRYLKPEERKGRRLLPPAPYRSWLEADVAQDLRQRKVKFKYESETIPYVEPVKLRNYTPDLILENGVIVEVKGRWTARDRQKMSLVIEQNPDKDIRMLFPTDNKISKNSKTRYSDWCEKRGIPYAVGSKVPKEWVQCP